MPTEFLLKIGVIANIDFGYDGGNRRNRRIDANRHQARYPERLDHRWLPEGKNERVEHRQEVDHSEQVNAPVSQCSAKGSIRRAESWVFLERAEEGSFFGIGQPLDFLWFVIQVQVNTDTHHRARKSFD